jgi:hypothetical protein
MRIGIDIGGTHTDGVLIDGTRLVAAAKAPTNHANLLESITGVLHSILDNQDPTLVGTINLSTTLTTNAIITGTTDPVGMLVVGGPGIARKTTGSAIIFISSPAALITSAPRPRVWTPTNSSRPSPTAAPKECGGSGWWPNSRRATRSMKTRCSHNWANDSISSPPVT